MRAEPFLRREDPDRLKRDPSLTRDLIRPLSSAPAVCITGSKGKGSVAAMVSAIVGTEKRVGMMTSPHILSFNERIRVDGEEISDEDLIRHISFAKNALDPVEAMLPPGKFISPMGIQAAAALSYFRERGTEFDVLECGKGAEFDDVNSAVHDYSVINTIFPEHTRELGPTLKDIVRDKMHVISEGQKCAYTGPQDGEVMGALRERARAAGVPLKEYGRDFRAENIRYVPGGTRFDVRADDVLCEGIVIPLLGGHQARNCALAFAVALDVLGELDTGKVVKSLSALRWPGRLETICGRPRVVLDATVNRRSAEEVVEVMKEAGMVRPDVIIGIPDDKDVIGVAEVMSKEANRMILTRSDDPHYVFSEDAVSRLSDVGIGAEWCPSLEEALERAMGDGRDILILGTTSLVSEAERIRLKLFGSTVGRSVHSL